MVNGDGMSSRSWRAEEAENDADEGGELGTFSAGGNDHRYFSIDRLQDGSSVPPRRKDAGILRSSALSASSAREPGEDASSPLTQALLLLSFLGVSASPKKQIRFPGVKRPEQASPELEPAPICEPV